MMFPDENCRSMAVLVPIFVRDAFFDGPDLSRLYINDLPNDIMCTIAIYDDNATFFFLSLVGSLSSSNFLSGF